MKAIVYTTTSNPGRKGPRRYKSGVTSQKGNATAKGAEIAKLTAP